jgi:tyrosine-protein kinase Fer
MEMCQLLQAWKTMLEELENTAKLMKQNADSVESKSLDKLNSLYAEKRRARKQYQEEHNRIVAQFTHVSSYFTLLLIVYIICLKGR